MGWDLLEQGNGQQTSTPQTCHRIPKRPHVEGCVMNAQITISLAPSTRTYDNVASEDFMHNHCDSSILC